MKSFCTSIFSLLLFVGCDRSRPPESTHKLDVLPSDLTTEEQALVDDVRQMFQRQDITPMTARFQEGSMGDWALSIHRSILEGILDEGLGRIELIRIDPPQTREKQRDGSIIEWIPPLKCKRQ